MTLKAAPVFDHAHPKIIELTYDFPEFVFACKNQFILLIHS